MSFNTPRWLADLQRLLTIRSQFIVSGHIRDTFLAPLPSGPALSPLVRTVWETLRLHDYQFLLLYDPADGLRVYPDEPLQREWAERLFDLKWPKGEPSNAGQPISLESLSKLLKNLVSQRTAMVPCYWILHRA
jgi:ATP-dependent Clp protease ATP-binding subunit ClpB